MKPASVIVPSILSVIAATTSTAAADRILVLSDRPEGTELSQVLTLMGHEAEKRAVLPEDLSKYDAVWHVSVTFAPTATERERLVTYLANGGGVLLTGERSCCEGANERIEALVNQVVIGGGDIQIGGLGDHAAAAHVVQSDVVGGVASSPYRLEWWHPAMSGAIGGVADRNVLTRTPDGVATSAVWDKHDLATGGRLAVMMDINWYQSDDHADELIANLYHFLIGRAVSCGDGIVDVTEQCDDANATDEDDCLASCEAAICGDGIVWAGLEQCDDAGNESGDGCSAGCEVEVDAGNVDGIADMQGQPAGADDPGSETTLDDDVDGIDPVGDQPGDDAAEIEAGGCAAGGGSGSAATLVLVLGAAIATARRAGGRCRRRS